MRISAAYLKRIQKLEVSIPAYCPEVEMRAIRLEAMDKLEHAIRMTLIHLMRRCACGQEMNRSPEVDAAMARWTGTIAELTGRAAAAMKYVSSFNRRIAQLERVQQPSTRRRLDDVQGAAIARTSLEDLKLLEQLNILELAGKGMEASAEQSMAVDRFAETFTDAFVAAGSRFSIAEMDQLLEA